MAGSSPAMTVWGGRRVNRSRPPRLCIRSIMFQLEIVLPAMLNGIATGAVYALVALGLTLIYGVLHIVNFSHGSLLMLALYGVYFLYTLLGIDPYLALPI